MPAKKGRLGYILSANMTRAQRAMALAMMAPDGRGKGKLKILGDCAAAERNAMQVALHKARLVLKYKPLLAAEVLSGMLLLDPAYKDAMAEVLVHLREAPECTNDAQDADGLLLA